MAVAWKDVEQNPQYQALPPDKKELARTQYFNDVVAPQLSPEQIPIAKAQFDKSSSLSETTVPAVQEQSTWEKIKNSPLVKLSHAANTINPLMAAFRANAKAQENLTDLTTKAAYKGGELTSEAATKLGASPEVAGGVGYVTNVGIQAAPVILSGMAGKKLSPTLQHKAENLMQSALKPTLGDLKSGNAKQAIDTLLEKGINVTPNGVEKLRSEIDILNNQIKQAVSTSPEKVKLIPIAREVLKKLNQFKMQVNPNADMNAIRASWGEFANHPLIAKSAGEISVPLAQSLKQGTYAQLAKKYGELGSASTEAQKTIARGLKEGIAEKVPQIAALNAEESKLINALNVTERRVLLSMNKNPVGLTALARNPALMAAFLADRSELFKSIVARMLYAGKEQIPATAARVLTGTAEVINQDRINRQQASQGE